MNERKFLRNSLGQELNVKEGRSLKRKLRKMGLKPSYWNCVALAMGDFDALK